MTAKHLVVLFAGGGTGGHLFPGLAIADEVQRMVPGTEIVFVGTKEKIEARVVPQRGYRFVPIWISGFRRKMALSNILFPLKVVVALVQSLFLIRKIKPDVVVGTGGYVCGPPLFAAILLRIPTLIQEQNSYPGMTTRTLAARVNEVHISFESSTRYLSDAKLLKLSGNPSNSQIGRVERDEGARHFGFDPGIKTLLVLGGSLGARSINDGVAKIISNLLALNVQVLWQTGQKDLERICGAVRSLPSEESGRVHVVGFIDRMAFGYAAADLAVCRAGAGTLAELAVAGVPSVLVPYPYAAADHQTENARAMVGQGAALMVKDNELNSKLFSVVSDTLADGAKLKHMANQARLVAKPEAAATLAKAVLALTKA